MHTETHHTQQQESVWLNFCSRSPQNFWNLIQLSKKKLMKRFATRTELKKNAENLTLIRKRSAKETELVVGNKVLLQQKRQGKLTSFCEPKPYNVVEKDESQVLIKSPAGDQYKRNVAHTS